MSVLRDPRPAGIRPFKTAGEMASLVDSLDWSKTPLGPAEHWPQSLRTAVSILLTSRYSMWMGWGSDLTFLYNDSYRPTLGLKHPWALGAPAREVWAEIWSDIGPRIQTVLASGRATWDEGLLLLLERAGFPEETYHTFSYSPLMDDAGEVSGMLCVVTEETERIIGERRMALLRELASDLAASNTEGDVIAAVVHRVGAYRRDLPFTITYLFDNDGGRARLACATGIEAGHEAAPPVIDYSASGVWPSDYVFYGGAPVLITNLPNRFAEPLPSGAWDKPPVEAAVVPIRQQGQDRPAGFIIAAINPYCRYDEAYAGFIALLSGQVASALANARAYEQERRRAEALAEIDRAKTAFFSNVSHEFRTPLTLMLGPVEDLLAEKDDTPFENARESLSLIHRNGLRLQRLVNALLDFSRIEAGRTQANYVPTDLAVFTSELASSFRSAMERAALQFSVDCPALPEPVYVDREMWEKVVLNLLSNAFKYTLAGSITVRLAASGRSAELTVSDTGEGIPEEELPRLFERFHRVEGARGRTHEGTGIGLALVQELVKLHGGSVTVASTLGTGSTFTVSVPFGTTHLPLERVGAERSLTSTAFHADAYIEQAIRWLPGAGNPNQLVDSDAGMELSHRSLVRGRVLLADDNADMREYVRRLLETRYEVTAVSNGEEVVAEAIAKPPDLVLTDVMMPILDGFQVLKILRADERTRTLPIILLSARAGEESRVEGLDAGADDYLVKPFTARELLARVEAHISLARMRREAERQRQFSELRLGLALQAAKMAAWEWDAANDQFSGTVDLNRIFDVVPRHLADAFAAVHPEDRTAYQLKVERVVSEGGSWSAEFRLCPVGERALTWVEEHAMAISDDSGRVLRIVGVDTDITTRKVIEQEMRRRNEELERANSELEEFAYIASHDLQEPLRTVNIYTQLLLQRMNLTEDERAIEFAEFISGGVERMQFLIRDVLAYARVVHREQEPAGPTDLNRSFAEALKTLDALVRETGAEITVGDLPVVRGQEAQLAQVFQNLLSNALKYRKQTERPRVRVSAGRKGAEWMISVADNGIGFDPEYSERIFGLFRRLHKDDYPGTGIGLAICNRIVERYGGRIWAESPGEGLGAAIFFTLRSVP